MQLTLFFVIPSYSRNVTISAEIRAAAQRPQWMRGGGGINSLRWKRAAEFDLHLLAVKMPLKAGFLTHCEVNFGLSVLISFFFCSSFYKNEEDDAPIKRCPKCKVYIERDEGCAQMMCKNCKHAFCWYCLESLDVSWLFIICSY